MIELVYAKFAPNDPGFFAEIQIETCSTVENESWLLVTGKLKSYFEYGPEIIVSNVVDIENWEAQQNQNFMWKQKSFLQKDCHSFGTKQIIQVSMWEPCCDTKDDEGVVCQKRARWISELPSGLKGY